MPLDSQEKDAGKKNEQRHDKLVRNEKRHYDAGYPPISRKKSATTSRRSWTKRQD